ncbi:hypothetical protein ATE62_19460 [Sphingopyxis sp. HIX]|nr:hypothetical protein ATE62_19460 [Sphingopyxis sp. HIX]KTE74375.1 hypothetical protein ATE72_21670 [Sphingopyxis sp. HXXIV]
MDILQIGSRDRADQWFEGYETDSRRNGAENVDAIEHFARFDAGTEPHIMKRWQGELSNHFSHSIRAFGQDLIAMLRRFLHHLPNRRDKSDIDLAVKEV